MDTAKIFKNGRSPKKSNPWQPLIDSLDKFSDEIFEAGRDQGKLERRDRLDQQSEGVSES